MRRKFDVRIVKNHWGWNPRGIRLWIKMAWAKPFAVWGIEHGITSERARALIRHFRGEEDVRIPHQDAHIIYRRRVKLGPLTFAAGMFQDDDKREP